MHFAEAVAEMGGTPILLDLKEKDIDNATASLSAVGYKAHGYAVDLTNQEQIVQVAEQIKKNMPS